MSYCRGSDSDVYALVGIKYAIHVHYGIDHELAGQTFRYEDTREFRDKLIWLSCNGLRVPNRAIVRIGYEIDGEWERWIKYIERELDEDED